MNRGEFENLFHVVVEQSIRNAELKLNKMLPRNTQFLLNGWGKECPTIDSSKAVDHLYIDDHSFYRIIDVGVIRYSEKQIFIVARRSGHKPSSFDGTWNDPKGMGPFKQIVFETIEFCPT